MSRLKILTAIVLCIMLTIVPAGMAGAKGGQGHGGNNGAVDQGRPDADRPVHGGNGGGQTPPDVTEETGIEDGDEQEQSLPNVIRVGNVIVPVKALINGFGASVAWDETTNILEVVKDGKQAQIDLENKTAVVNGKTIDLTLLVDEEDTDTPDEDTTTPDEDTTTPDEDTTTPDEDTFEPGDCTCNETISISPGLVKKIFDMGYSTDGGTAPPEDEEDEEDANPPAGDDDSADTGDDDSTSTGEEETLTN